MVGHGLGGSRTLGRWRALLQSAHAVLWACLSLPREPQQRPHLPLRIQRCRAWTGEKRRRPLRRHQARPTAGPGWPVSSSDKRWRLQPVVLAPLPHNTHTNCNGVSFTHVDNTKKYTSTAESWSPTIAQCRRRLQPPTPTPVNGNTHPQASQTSRVATHGKKQDVDEHWSHEQEPGYLIPHPRHRLLDRQLQEPPAARGNRPVPLSRYCNAEQTSARELMGINGLGRLPK